VLTVLARVAAGIPRVVGEGPAERRQLIEELAPTQASHGGAGLAGLLVEIGCGRADGNARGGGGHRSGETA
jgi:hypothetical protein